MSNVLIEDVLEKEAVVITMLVQPGERGRDERSVLVTVGIADKQVVMRTGTFAQMTQLVNAAWAEYAQVVTDDVLEPESETGVIAEAEVGADTTEFAYSDDDF